MFSHKPLYVNELGHFRWRHKIPPKPLRWDECRQSIAQVAFQYAPTGRDLGVFNRVGVGVKFNNPDIGMDGAVAWGFGNTTRP